VVPQAFNDLGSMQGTGKDSPTSGGNEPANELGSGIEVRIDMGHGMVLHMLRR
jgi:hypothetical protein